MKIFKPQLQLVKQTNKDKSHDYYLHAVTFADRTSYRAHGVEALPTTLNERGNYEVNLLIARDSRLPDFKYLTPIVHTLLLGQLPFAEEGDIEVNVFITELGKEDTGLSRLSGSKNNNQRAGGSVTGTTSADGDARPIFNTAGV